MKKVLFLILFVTAGSALTAQQFGLSAHGLMFFQNNRDVETSYGNPTRTFKTGIAPAPGFRLEANYILPGFNIPVSAYNGLGVTYMAPATDSANFFLRTTNSGMVEVVGEQKTSMLSIGLRFGYEFPQQFNDFLIIHYGWGLAWTQFKTTHVLPAKSPTFNYDASDFSAADLEPVKFRGASVEIFIGAVYEFESFSLMGQYSLILPVMIDGEQQLRHGPSIGIFYPLYRLM